MSQTTQTSISASAFLITRRRHEIIFAIASCHGTIVKVETSTGKSLSVPQFLHDVLPVSSPRVHPLLARLYGFFIPHSQCVRFASRSFCMFLHGFLGRSIPPRMPLVRQTDQTVASSSRAIYDRVFGKFLLSTLLTLKRISLMCRSPSPAS